MLCAILRRGEGFSGNRSSHWSSPSLDSSNSPYLLVIGTTDDTVYSHLNASCLPLHIVDSQNTFDPTRTRKQTYHPRAGNFVRRSQNIPASATRENQEVRARGAVPGHSLTTWHGWAILARFTRRPVGPVGPLGADSPGCSDPPLQVAGRPASLGAAAPPCGVGASLLRLRWPMLQILSAARFLLRTGGPAAGRRPTTA